MAQLKHVLEGYSVLDFTQVLAGPTATRMMAEMGAEVIKVELAPSGDPSRALPFLKDGRSAYYVQQNRGKKSLCIDVKNPAGLEIIKALIPKMDVMIENYAPGVITRMGLGYQTVSALNPKIVMCSISSLGQSGPLADRAGYDTVGAAYAGVIDMCGYPDRAPVFPHSALATSAPASMRWRLSPQHSWGASAAARANMWKPHCSTATSAITN